MLKESIAIDGWGVASLELDRRWDPLGEGFPDKIFLFRSHECWALLVLHHTERERDGVRSGSASVAVRRFSSLEELADHVRTVYGSDSWYEVLEPGRDDPDLLAAWVPEWFPRAFRKASIFRRELAICSGLFTGGPLPAPARQLAGWRERALELMASRLRELRFDVTAVVPAERAAEPVGTKPSENVIVGQLRVRRYGFETTGVVRVDSVGEIYVRLDDDPIFQVVADEESP